MNTHLQSLITIKLPDERDLVTTTEHEYSFAVSLITIKLCQMDLVINSILIEFTQMGFKFFFLSFLFSFFFSNQTEEKKCQTKSFICLQFNKYTFILLYVFKQYLFFTFVPKACSLSRELTVCNTFIYLTVCDSSFLDVQQVCTF